MIGALTMPRPEECGPARPCEVRITPCPVNPAALQRSGSFMAPFDELRRFKIVENVTLGNRLNLTSSGVIRAVVLTGIGALAIGAAVSAFAVEQNAAPNLKPDASFNAKWNRCERGGLWSDLRTCCPPRRSESYFTSAVDTYSARFHT
jgi:hypothetical protein